ncbi:hypothetical protein P8935_22415 [Telmatobacter sp. DSM 110680]|uniref:META domain-containing protein n=1 Tax=Telmatobacter sp. DSM 110680 TaxID=3036704 RepID=A0AAU7DJ07_9BACT
MNVKSPLLLCLYFFAAVLAGCHHWPSPWDGQWTLDESKSHFAAPTLTITLTPEGMYHVDDGVIDYSFRCDGNPYPTTIGSGGFFSCTQTDPTTIVLKEKAVGPNPTNIRWELSTDGKTLTTIDRLIQIGGSTKDKQLVYARDPEVRNSDFRDSGSTGFSGRWIATRPFDFPSKTVVLILNYNAFHFEDQDWGQVSDSLIDEPPTPIRGANQRFGFSRSVRMPGLREIQTEDTCAGRVILRTTWKVSDDGRTLSEEFWVPEKPSQKNLLVYRKY